MAKKIIKEKGKMRIRTQKDKAKYQTVVKIEYDINNSTPEQIERDKEEFTNFFKEMNLSTASISSSQYGKCPNFYNCNREDLDTDCWANGKKAYGCHELKKYLDGQYEKLKGNKLTENDMSPEELAGWRPHYDALVARIKAEGAEKARKEPVLN